MHINSNSRAGATSRRAVLKRGAFAAATLAFSRLGWAFPDHQPAIPKVRLAHKC
jgi:2,5-diketo-D-gluconate reductase A